MENKSHVIAAVAFILVFGIGAAVFFFWLQPDQSSSRIYQVETSHSVGGLASESSVKFMGLKVGHILSVDFAADDPNKIQILFAVDNHIPVTESSYAQLATQGIAGLKTLNLSNPNPKAKPLKTDSTHPANVPLHQALLSHLENSGQQIMQKINNILNSAQQLLNKNNRQHLAQTIAHIDKASRQMQLAIAKIDRLTTQAQGPVAQAGQVEDSVQSLSNSADRLTRRLNDHTLPRIDGLISTLNQTAHHLDQLSQELATKPNSVIMGPPKARPGPGEPGLAK